jgi:hypothetical protein
MISSWALTAGDPVRDLMQDRQHVGDGFRGVMGSCRTKLQLRASEQFSLFFGIQFRPITFR